jgi:hypothetical protein
MKHLEISIDLNSQGYFILSESARELMRCPEVRQGINSLANSKSRLKPTEIRILSRLQTTFTMRRGFQPLADYRAIELSDCRIA